MLDEIYQEKTIDELLELLDVAKKCGSASVQDFKDLIIQKFQLEKDSYKAFVQEPGGWGFIGENIIQLRELLEEYNLYEPNKNHNLFQRHFQ